jgi:hypothetical protein
MMRLTPQEDSPRVAVLNGESEPVDSSMIVAGLKSQREKMSNDKTGLAPTMRCRWPVPASRSRGDFPVSIWAPPQAFLIAAVRIERRLYQIGIIFTHPNKDSLENQARVPDEAIFV